MATSIERSLRTRPFGVVFLATRWMGWVLASLLWVLSCGSAFGATLDADVQKGVNWLLGQVQSSGALLSESASVALPMQARAESITTLHTLSQSLPATLLSAIAAVTPDTTEYLAHKALTKQAAGSGDSTLLDSLVALQNSDGGFWAIAGIPSNPQDTAWAVRALAASRSTTSAAINALKWLLSAQQSDGAWALVHDGDTVVITALVVQSLAPYRQQSSVQVALTKARSWLTAQRNTSQTWSDAVHTAHALLAVLPGLSTADTLQAAVADLRQAQLANGSWANDPYITALALRALWLATQPTTNPDLNSIRGRILDGDTGMPLTGVKVTLSGMSSAETITTTGGYFVFDQLLTGSYQLIFELANYNLLSAATSLTLGTKLDFGDLLMVRHSNATTGTIYGVVSDATSGEGIAYATINANGIQATANEVGHYQINAVPPGTITIVVQKDGYDSAVSRIELNAGGSIIFSPQLAVTQSSEPSLPALFGIITDAITGSPLSGVTIKVTGDTKTTAQTDIAGYYRIEPLAVGSVNIAVSLSGYDSILVQTLAFDGQQIHFSPALYPTGSTPKNGNTSTISGFVVDSTTNQSLSGTSILVTHDGATSTTVTDNTGYFEISGITTYNADINVTHEGYVPAIFRIAVDPLSTVDLGQIRLRPKGVEKLFPDLTISTVDTTQLLSDPNTLYLQGILDVVIYNKGTQKSTNPFELLAFTDSNLNGQYDPTIDVILGTATVSNNLAISEKTIISIPLNGTTPYRDSPILVWVDSSQTIIEQDEFNNIFNSAIICNIKPVDSSLFEPIVKWAWYENKVFSFSIPLVSPLIDTNLDGRLNTDDDPVIAFITCPTKNIDFGAGPIVAINGKTGKTLWYSDSNKQLRASSHLAIGDLEGDGIPEIVGYGPDTKVIAFTNTGKVKWVSSEAVPNSYYNYGGISIADLNGDGKAEILARSNVYNSDGSLRWSTGYYISDITTSIAADLDNDGLQEVIIGHDAYRHDGTPYWPVTRAGGFTAIGNFDDDKFPEVVFRNFPSVQLIDQDGSIIWSVNHPTGYRGGAPIVADFDGDGDPEIGVPGGSSYVMFDGDGSILWEYRGTSDGSAAGAAAFDFNGDGRMEVVYGDHSYLRVFDGLTGKVIFSIPNSSPTASEMPTVADIDADGHAEILVQSSQGLHAIEDRNDTWLATRKLWNQYQYHIDNINDDLSIPTHPRPSWLTHNTFRLNTFPDRNPLDRADLSVALLRLVDNGIGQSQSLTARIGNGGLLSITQPIQVAFYQGNSVANGVLLGIIKLDSLAHGTYIDIRLDGINLHSEEPLYVIVDSDDQYPECNETNNSMSIPFSAPLSGTIVVNTDASSYGAQSPITLQTTVTNSGSFTNDYRMILAIVDSNGILVTQFDTQSVTSLNSGASLDLSQIWNTGTYTTGVYTLIGTLLDEQGQVLDIASTLFTITPGNVANAPKAALTVNTDQAQYLPDDRVLISNLLRNLTTNALLDDVRVELQVYNSASTLVFSYTHTVGQLSAGALRTLEAPQILKNAAVGTYTVKATLIGSGEGLKSAVLGQGRLKAYGVDITLATATARYTVVSRNGTAQEPQPGLQRIPTLGTSMLMLMSALLTGITACMRRRFTPKTSKTTRSHPIHQATGEGR